MNPTTAIVPGRLLLGLIGVFLGATLAAEGARNVIVMVPDGCDQSLVTLARWVKGEPLNLDPLAVGMVRTHMKNSVITGSAAAATAFATGRKTTARFLSIGPRPNDVLSTESRPAEGEPYMPYATVLEAARHAGKAVGLVATSRITHATPAAYAGHVPDRGMENALMEQMVYQNLDVVFGGGARHLLPESEGGRRRDGENLKEVLLRRGVQYVETARQLSRVEEGPVWGMFADSHLVAHLDRGRFAPRQPTLTAMTRKALTILSRRENGFFLVVEGSQVDWAGHVNDAGYMVTEFLEFDRAVGEVTDFAEADGDTLVLVFPDHNTGGLQIGNRRTGRTYTSVTVEEVVDPVRNMTLTAGGLAKHLGARQEDDQALRQAVAQYWKLDFTRDDVDAVRNLQKQGRGLAVALCEIVSQRHTAIGWTTHGHTGGDVPLWAFGPGAPRGTLDNTELAIVCAETLQCDLDTLQQELFVPAPTALAGLPVTGSLVREDPRNPVYVVSDGKRQVRFPVSKDVALIDSRAASLGSLIIFAPETGTIYVPRAARNVLDHHFQPSAN